MTKIEQFLIYKWSYTLQKCDKKADQRKRKIMDSLDFYERHMNQKSMICIQCLILCLQRNPPQNPLPYLPFIKATNGISLAKRSYLQDVDKRKNRKSATVSSSKWPIDSFQQIGWKAMKALLGLETILEIVFYLTGS